MRLPRRRLFAASSATALLPKRVYAQRGDRPRLEGGVQAGDPTFIQVTLWARSDRAARLVVEWSTTESFAEARQLEGPLAGPDADFTAQLRLVGLPAGQTIFYRLRFVEPASGGFSSEPASGRLTLPASAPRDVSFVWSADTVGQGFGINPDLGGMRIYETMRSLRPDFFVHCGDTIYADNPLSAEVRLPDGTIWRNLVTEAKSKVAETLDEFRGNFRYNLLDANLRRFNADVPQIALWDDHEVVDNWHWNLRLDSDPRYREKDAGVLARRAARAFSESVPMASAAPTPDRTLAFNRRFAFGPDFDLFRLDMRSHRAANGPNLEPTAGPATAFLGRAQLDWLKAALKTSRATWKVIAASMPLGLIVWDDWRRRQGSEAIANGDNGPPLGREHEIAELLSFLARESVRNVVWICGDVHYPAMHLYDPTGATFGDFQPFHEFVSGPLNAGGFGPNALDRTFGPRILFQKTPPAGRFNTAPSEGSAHFGHIRIVAKTRRLIQTHRDAAGTVLHTTELDPA